MGRRSWTFAAFVVVVGVAACWWLLCAHDPSLSDAPRTPGNAIASPPIAVSAASEHTVAGVVDAPTRVAPVEPAAAEGNVQVLVLGVDGAPVARAIVHYGDPREMASTKRLYRFDVEQMLKELGTQRITDDDGIARWPAQPQEKRHWHVVARAAEQFGELWIAKTAPATEVHTLQMQPDLRALVRVLDDRHQPVAGVPVAATYAGKGDQPYTGREPLGASDAAGDVVLHHLQLWSERIEPRGTVLPAMLGLALPGVPPAHEIDAARPPAEPIVLFVPPTGEIEVIAMDAGGNARADERIVLMREGANVGDGASMTTDVCGIAMFDRVGVGHSWRVGFARLDPRGWRLVVGPKAPHERVTVRFQPAAGPMLTGRLLRDGAPARSEAVSVEIGDATASAGAPTTDDEGRFRIALAAAWLDRRIDAMHFETSEDRGAWRGAVVLTAGDHELGDVVLVPLPVIVVGTLVGAGGSAVPEHARLAIQHTLAGDDAWRWARVSLPLEADGTFLARVGSPGLQEIQITVPQADTAERASPTSGGGFVFVLEGDEPTARCVQLDGPLAFFTVTRPLDVRVRVPGCRDKVVRGLTADTTVELEPGIPVVLRREGAATPAGEITWSLAPLDDRIAAVRAAIYSPACGGSLPVPFHEGTAASAPATPEGATVRVAAPGRYRITAQVRTAADGERFLACDPAAIQVPNDGCAVTVTVR